MHLFDWKVGMVYGKRPCTCGRLGIIQKIRSCFVTKLLRNEDSWGREGVGLGREEEKHDKLVEKETIAPEKWMLYKGDQKIHLGEQVLGSGNDFAERLTLLTESDV